MRKEVEFVWSESCEEAFNALKRMQAPALAFPDFSLGFLLETDASGLGLGAQRVVRPILPMAAILCRCTVHLSLGGAVKPLWAHTLPPVVLRQLSMHLVLPEVASEHSTVNLLEELRLLSDAP